MALMGRPPHMPDRKSRGTVSLLAGFGVPHRMIAEELHISEPTLHKHYQAELDQGKDFANTRVVKNLFAKATGDSPQAVTAAIFWLKARAGWRDVAAVEVTGRNGGPIETTEETARDRVQRRIARLTAGLPLLPSAVERDVEETEAGGGEGST